MDKRDDLPDWWQTNVELKRMLQIPEYDPPRFSDGEYTHSVIETLEDTYGCTIRFVGYNTNYPEDWTVNIDGIDVFSIGRRRDENGNTVYQMTADEFTCRFEDEVRD